MRVVFSAKGESWKDVVDPRLGRADQFVVFDEETRTMQSFSNIENAAKEHGAGLHMAKFIMDLNADVVITGNGPGEKAKALFEKSDIKIYVGAGEMLLRDAYKAYKEQKLTKFN